MKIFLDTSSLVKLYHREVDTAELESFFSTKKVTAIFLSEILKIEFTSTIWKKVRTKEITVAAARRTLDLFESDFIKYTFIATSSTIIEEARLFQTKYGMEGLRTLDSIQLATSISLMEKVEIFITSDKLLQSFFEKEGLPTMQ
jgi:predicted nucleic acid-binding protein